MVDDDGTCFTVEGYLWIEATPRFSSDRISVVCKPSTEPTTTTATTTTTTPPSTASPPTPPDKLVRSDADFKAAAKHWCRDPAGAEARFGHISRWDVSQVKDMSSAFYGDECTAFNAPIGGWDVRSATNMKFMFRNAAAFDQPLGSWDMGLVRNMQGMFLDASSFNQPISTWDTRSAKNMNSLFRMASAFDQPLGNWNTDSVENMRHAFTGATGMSACNKRNIVDSGAFGKANMAKAWSSAGCKKPHAGPAVLTAIKALLPILSSDELMAVGAAIANAVDE
jgi:surface protein